MDRKAQMDRLIWLATTDISARKRYAWETALSLDEDYPGISAALTQAMTGLAANTASESHTQPRLRLVGQK
jgi:hypothetical protein